MVLDHGVEHGFGGAVANGIRARARAGPTRGMPVRPAGMCCG